MVVFRAADGRTLTMADLQGLTGTFQYEILGKSNVPAEAQSLHKQARQAGGTGDYKKAITLLERASSLAPAWPYPVYDMAFTYLLMKDAENARKHYRKTVELAPRGFFTALTALDALDSEAKGDLPAGTYLAYLSLEWMDDPGKQAEAVRQLVKRVPGFAPHFLLGHTVVREVRFARLLSQTRTTACSVRRSASAFGSAAPGTRGCSRRGRGPRARGRLYWVQVRCAAGRRARRAAR